MKVTYYRDNEGEPITKEQWEVSKVSETVVDGWSDDKLRVLLIVINKAVEDDFVPTEFIHVAKVEVYNIIDTDFEGVIITQREVIDPSLSTSFRTMNAARKHYQEIVNARAMKDMVLPAATEEPMVIADVPKVSKDSPLADDFGGW
ncbi:hypothetical protein [Methyloversatilis sp.]|uniref:hypothetical protein n=1 Tax=Methyloversatilis sp. TaxID=2569862 RepID=UPI0035AFC369